MALHLTFATDLLGLFTSAREKIYGAWKNPLRPPTLVFPNEKNRIWFFREWRKHYGVIANLPSDLLERRLWEALKTDDKQMQLRREVLAQIAIAALAKWFAEPDFPEALKKYLSSPSDAHKIHPQRLTQFGAKIAKLFIEYENSRPDNFLSDKNGILSKWAKFPFFSKDGKDEDEDEKWQRELYRRIFSADGVLENAFKTASQKPGEPLLRYLTLPQLYAKSQKKMQAAHACPLFIFSFSGVGQFHRVVINHLAETQEVYAYLFNPCQEYWQDIFDKKLKITAQPESEIAWDECGKNGGNVPDILRKWGRGGAENIFLWCEQANYTQDFYPPEGQKENARKNAREDDTLLKKIQTSLLMLSNSKCDYDRVDRSLTITPAPSRMREVEFLREQIWADLKHDENLRLDDIIVWSPALDKYRAAIALVFGAEGEDALPIAFADCAEKSSLVEQAWTDFFALFPATGGEFNRVNFLKFLRNPLVAATRKLDDKTLNAWEKWLENLGVYRKVADKDSPHDWLRGVRRLLLGQLTRAPFCADTDAEPLEIPYDDMKSRDSDFLEKFCDTLEKLLDWEKRLQESPKDVLTWLESDFFQNWLAPKTAADMSRYEAAILQASQTALKNLQWQIYAGRKNIEPIEIRETILEACANHPRATGDFLIGGITFAQLATAQALPFRYVYLLGMNAADFPSPNNRDTMDLRVTTAKRQPRWLGDVDNEKQSGWTLLEQLLSAQTALRISYLGKDAKKDEALEASTPVIELANYLRSFTGDKWQEDEMLKFIPGKNAIDQISSHRDFHRWLAAHYPNVTKSGGSNKNAASAEDVELTAEEVEKIPAIIELKALKEFVENPFLFRVKTVMGKAKEVEETEELEPVKIDHFRAAEVRKNLLRELVTDAGKSDHQKLLENWQKRGKIPADFFIGKDKERWEKWSEWADDFLSGKFGDYANSSPQIPPKIPLIISAQTAQKEIVLLPFSQAILLQDDAKNYLWLTAKKAETAKKEDGDVALIEGYLSALYLAASESADKLTAVLLAEDNKTFSKEWEFSADEAKKILADLIGRAFAKNFAANLPLAMIVEEAKENAEPPLSFAKFVAELKKDEFRPYLYYPDFYAKILSEDEWTIADNDDFHRKIKAQIELLQNFFIEFIEDMENKEKKEAKEKAAQENKKTPSKSASKPQNTKKSAVAP